MVCLFRHNDSEEKLTANVIGNHIEGCLCGVYISGCKQYVDIGNLVKGWNVVRLDEPFVIKSEYADVKVGCFLKHDLAVKPMAVDKGPAVIGRGDVYAEYTTFITFFRFEQNFAVLTDCFPILAFLFTLFSLILQQIFGIT